MIPQDSLGPLGDFRNFLYLAFKHLGLPDPTPIQYDFAYYLQHGPCPDLSPADAPNDRIMGQAFRGMGKSTITGVFACWNWLEDPDRKVVIVAAAKKLADDISTFVSDLIATMPILAHLQPRSEQRTSKLSFDVGPARPAKQPSCTSLGILGMLVGNRADLIISDDVETELNTLTHTNRDKIKQAVKQYDAVVTPGGRIVYLGTPQSHSSIYNDLPARGYHLRVWPARYPAPLAEAPLQATPEALGTPESGRAATGDLARVGRAATAGRDLRNAKLSRARWLNSRASRMARRIARNGQEVLPLRSRTPLETPGPGLDRAGSPLVPVAGHGGLPELHGSVGDLPAEHAGQGLLPGAADDGAAVHPLDDLGPGGGLGGRDVGLPLSGGLSGGLSAGIGDQRAVGGEQVPGRNLRAEGLPERLAPMLLEALLSDPSLVGRPTEPTRFGDDDLLAREASWGRTGFALQFMLDTRLADADRHPLKLSDLAVVDLDSEVGPSKVVWGRGPELQLDELACVGLDGDRYYRPMALSEDHLPYTGGVLFVDPAGRGKDETALAVVKILHGQLFVLECSGLAGGYEDETLQVIAETAKLHKVNLVLVEDNFGDGMYARLLSPFLRRAYPVALEGVHHNLQKEKRIIDTLEPLMNQHRLIVNRRVIERDLVGREGESEAEHMRRQLFYQMSRITREKGCLAHDDRLDALAGACGYFVDQMAVDPDEAGFVSKERLKEQALRDFVELAKGTDRKGRPSIMKFVPQHRDRVL